MRKNIYLLFTCLVLLLSCIEKGIDVGLPKNFVLEIIYPNPTRLTDTITLGLINQETDIRLGSGDKLLVIAKKNGKPNDTLNITGVYNQHEYPVYSSGKLITNPYIETIKNQYKMIIQCDIGNIEQGNWNIEVIAGAENTTSKVSLLVFD